MNRTAKVMAPCITFDAWQLHCVSFTCFTNGMPEKSIDILIQTAALVQGTNGNMDDLMILM